MEKYRHFGDKGTGVHPFTPAWSHHKVSFPVRAAKFIVLFPVALLRLLLLVLAFVWLVLGTVICTVIPVPVLRYPVQRFFDSFGCWVALFALGFLMHNEEVALNQRLKLPVAKGPKGTPTAGARAGSLVLCNQQCLVDVLYLCMRSSPVFVFTVSGGVPVRVGLFGALRFSSSRRPTAPRGRPVALPEVLVQAKASWQPVVLFPEGARTVGNCVLPFQPRAFEGVKALEGPAGCTLCALEYSRSGAYTPHHTVGGPLAHVGFMMLQPWHTLKAVWLPPAEVAAATKGKPVEEQVRFARTLLTRMLPQAVEAEVAAETHVEFMDFWDASRKKGYTQQSKKA